MISVSFIIVTRNRPLFLKETLISLVQNCDSFCEVIIIDNSDDNASMQSVASLGSSGEFLLKLRYSKVKFFEEILSVGRNIGAQVATGELLAFIDDDVLLASSWLATCREVFSDPSCAALAGRIIEPDSADLDPHQPLPVAQLLNNGRLTDNFYCITAPSIRVDHARGCNWVVRSDVFKKLGGFSSLFKHLYEEADLSLQLKKRGYKMVFHPGLLVDHRCGPRSHHLRQDNPKIKYLKERIRLSFYMLVLLRFAGLLNPLHLRYLISVDTGAIGFLRQPTLQSFLEMANALVGKLQGYGRYIMSLYRTDTTEAPVLQFLTLEQLQKQTSNLSLGQDRILS